MTKEASFWKANSWTQVLHHLLGNSIFRNQSLLYRTHIPPQLGQTQFQILESMSKVEKLFRFKELSCKDKLPTISPKREFLWCQEVTTLPTSMDLKQREHRQTQGWFWIWTIKISSVALWKIETQKEFLHLVHLLLLNMQQTWTRNSESLTNSMSLKIDFKFCYVM